MTALQMKLVKGLSPLYLKNIKDIDKQIKSPAGSFTLCDALNKTTCNDSNGHKEPLCHLVHKTNKPHIITLLVDTKLLTFAEQKLANLHNEILNLFPAELHHQILFPDCPVQLTGRIIDTASSQAYANYVDEILAGNPQDNIIEAPLLREHE